MRQSSSTSWYGHDHDNTAKAGSRHYVCTGDHRGTVCYADSGDWFAANDRKADGKVVVIDWETIDAEGDVIRTGQVFKPGGQASGWGYRNKDFIEKDHINFRLCPGTHRSERNYTWDQFKCTGWKSTPA